MKSSSITLITGTSRGIGRHLAEHYLAQGHVVLGVSRTPPDLSNKNYYHFAVDLADEAAVRSMFDQIRTQFGFITNLINNAGMASLNPFLLSAMGGMKKLMDLNFFGTWLCCQESARLMHEKKFGRIVNFSSIAVPLHSEGLAVYAASKAAVEEFTKVLAKELGPMGITVNCVGPSIMDTEMGRGLPKERIAESLSRQAIPHQSLMEDVSNVVDFYLSQSSGMITGQILYLGGF